MVIYTNSKLCPNVDYNKTNVEKLGLRQMQNTIRFRGLVNFGFLEILDLNTAYLQLCLFLFYFILQIGVPSVFKYMPHPINGLL